MIHIKQATEQQNYVDLNLLLYLMAYQLTIIKYPVEVDIWFWVIVKQ